MTLRKFKKYLRSLSLQELEKCLGLIPDCGRIRFRRLYDGDKSLNGYIIIVSPLISTTKPAKLFNVNLKIS